MNEVRKFYIHGYNSTGECVAEGLRNAGLQDLELVRWSCDKPFEETLSDISKQIPIDEEICVVASSFGGYWATRLRYENIAHVFLINPLMDPIKYFHKGHFNKSFTAEIAKTYIGRNDTLVGSEQRLSLYLARADEVLDYREAEKVYKGTCQIKYIEGGHIFENFKEVAYDVLQEQYQIALTICG